jgi:hypothetical protein
VTSAEDNGFFNAAQPLYEKYAEGYQGPPAPTRDEVNSPMRTLLDGNDGFGEVKVSQVGL